MVLRPLLGDSDSTRLGLGAPRRATRPQFREDFDGTRTCRIGLAARRGPHDGPVGELLVAPAVMERLEPMMLPTKAFQVGDKSLIRPSPVGSFGLKGFHREPTVFWCCGPGYGVCSGSVNRL